MIKTILTATLAGGIAYFLLGWLIYGTLLYSYMEANTNTAISRGMEGMLMWAIALSNFLWTYFLVRIMLWKSNTGFLDGLKTGFTAGLLVSLSINFSLYAGTTYYSNLNALFLDVAGMTVMSALSAGVAGLLIKPVPAPSA